MVTTTDISNSIAKARAAQIQFEETKAKVEAVKAKAEEAVKKAKAVQQQLVLLKSLSNAPGGVQGGIAAIVATQVGTLRAKLVSQVQRTVFELIQKFTNQCPSSTELQKIIKIRNNLLKILNSFQSRLDKFASIADTLASVINTTKTLIQVITSIPIPTSVPPGVGIPISILTKYSNVLIGLNKSLDKLTSEALAISSMISSAKPLLDSLKSKLEVLDIVIQNCSLDPNVDIAAILSTAQPKGNTGSEGIPNASYEYKGYVLSILQDIKSSKIAPSRYAIATDSRGIVVLKGPLSFSSSTQVLLEEIKFRIDNKLA